MSDPTLEERVGKLEKFVDELKRKPPAAAGARDWRRTVGVFDGDPVMKEVIEEGRRIREDDRRQAGS